MRATRLRHARPLLAAVCAPLLLASISRDVSDRPQGVARALPTAHSNDNRVAAGKIAGSVLTLRLVVGMARWRPESEQGPFVDVPAFAEEGHAPQVPGPMIRVRAGTEIDATVRNDLADSVITIHGLQTRPAEHDDSLRLAPGETRHLHFTAGAPGTYFYHAVAGRLNTDSSEREQLAGAFIIDSVGGRPNDRVFVVNIWGQQKDSATYSNALAINGRSWPFTERITATVGDTLRWRVVNASARSHPMHLHGFYYRVDSHGDEGRDSVYGSEQVRDVVTDILDAGQTSAITWIPTREGNWLYHCHLGFHVFPDSRLEPTPAHHGDALAHDPAQHMAGLVLGISVASRAGARPPARGIARQLHLFVQEGEKRSRAPRAMRFVLQPNVSLPPTDPNGGLSSTLVLTRGVPTDITVVNTLKEATGVHWHGIELESWSDGVVGWSGMGANVAPLIAPGDSFVAHLTLPRAGTFIYHTHLNDFEQVTSGLYGGIIVLEPGQRYDPLRDHLFVIGWDGPQDPPHWLVNGDSLPPPMEMRVGQTQRLRFVNIGVAVSAFVVLRRDSAVVRWRALAKDGANLPATSATVRPAVQRVGVGETYDFELASPVAGRYRLALEKRDGTPVWQQSLLVR
ncbi:MAG: multicopper oxidase domain-containing protein [Gemmatimonadaceae bacterium]